MTATYLTVKQIAEKLNFSRRTVQLWLEQGKLKGYRFGKDYRIKQEDFEEFLATHKLEELNSN